MDAKELDELNDEEFEMLINGIIHPDEMFTPPNFSNATPFGATPSVGAMPSIGGGGSMPFAATSIDNLLMQDWDEEDEAE